MGKRRKDKPRWKDLPFHEWFARELKQRGASEERCERIRKRGDTSKI